MALPSNLVIINDTDYTPYVQSTGLGWTRNDLDDESSGRTLDAVMHRKRVAQKRTLQIKMRRMNSGTIKQLCADLSPKTLFISYPDPEVFDTSVTPPVYTRSLQVYGTQVQATLVFGDQPGDVMYWDDISFQLTEV